MKCMIWEWIEIRKRIRFEILPWIRKLNESGMKREKSRDFPLSSSLFFPEEKEWVIYLYEGKMRGNDVVFEDCLVSFDLGDNW